MFVKTTYPGCAALVGLSPAYENDCLPPLVTIAGQLRIVESRHSDWTPIRAIVVFVEDGQCVSIEDVDGEHANVVLRAVHLAPKDDETLRWSEDIGDEVTVQGRMGLPHGMSAPP